MLDMELILWYYQDNESVNGVLWGEDYNNSSYGDNGGCGEVYYY